MTKVSGKTGAVDDSHYFSDFDWLKTYWLFSLSGYDDPANIQFGVLRVFNDDVIAPHTGFGTHPHEDLEIMVHGYTSKTKGGLTRRHH